jgi:ABC-type sugar transport system substrate-binding protein
MRILKHTLAKLGVAACLAALSAIPSHSQDLKGKRVALLTNAATSPWIAAYNKTIIAALAKDGVKVVNMVAPQDPALQSQQLDDAASQHFDLIVLNAINEVSVVPALQRVKKAGIPVIMSVQPPPAGNESLYVSVVGHRGDDEGRVAARQMAKALAGKSGGVGVIQGNPSQAYTRSVVEGFTDELEKDSKLKVVAVEGKSWRPDDAAAAAAQLALRFQGANALKGVFGIIDSQGLQAAAAFRAAGVIPGKDIVIVTSSCDKRGIAAVKSGVLDATVNLSPSAEGELMAGEILKFLKGAKIKKEVWFQPVAVTSANVDKYAASCTF